MIQELVSRLLERGVRLRAEGERLLCSAPAGVLTAELRDEIGRNKEALLALLREASGSGRASAPVQRVSGEGPWMLSTAQERFWLMEQLSAGQGVYNVPGAFRLEGALDADALEAALRAFVRRHAILDVRFEDGAGGARMLPAHLEEVCLERFDLRDVPDDAREAALRDLLETWAEEPLDLVAGDTFRARLVALAAEEHALFVVSHAVVWDGWSFDVMLSELSSLYPSAVSGVTDGVLPDPPIQYTDYARWQRGRLAEGALDAQLSYWRTRLASPRPVVSLPTDRPRPPATFSGARLNFTLDPRVVATLSDLARDENATLFMVLLAAFAALLHRYTRQEDLTILTPVRGRDRMELEGLVGCFANMMPMRLQPSSSETFLALLRRVREHCLDAYANAEAPFDVLAGELEGAGAEGAGSLFRVTFTYQNTTDRPHQLGEVRISTIQRDHRHSYSEVGLWVRERPGHVDGALDYRTDLFRASTMEGFLMHYETVLRDVAAKPRTRLRDLLVHPEPFDRRAVRSGAERTVAEAPAPPAPSLMDLLRSWASRDPGRVALEADGATLTYGDLLARLGAPQPVDSDGGTGFVENAPEASPLDAVVSALAALRSGTGCGLDLTVPPPLEDRAVGRTLVEVATLLEAGADDTVLIPGNLSRPAILQAALLPLVVGARAVFAGDRAGLDEWELADVLETSRATILSVPTHLCGRLRETDWEGDAQLRVLCLGECPRPDAAEWLAARTGGSWWVDGQPDACVWALCGPITRTEAAGGLGRVLPDLTAHVLDEEGRRVEHGVPGELAMEIHDRRSSTGRTVIRTGELVREVDGETLHRLGRIDGRVAIDGVLVDPASVERILRTLPAVLDAAACPTTRADGDRRLLAYLVWRDDADRPTTTELRDLVRRRLGEAHVPSAFVPLEEIPRLSDGTADPESLPSPFDDDAPPETFEHLGPRTSEEELICQVWRELLRVERVDIADNFYTLGGNSLMLMRAVDLIETRTGRRLDPRILFFHSLEGVAQALAEAGGVAQESVRT